MACRLSLWTVAGLSLLVPVVAHAQGDAAEHANRLAYQAAMKCFVVNGRAANLRKKAGDVAGEQSYEAKASHAFDAAVTLGLKLSRNRDQIDADFSLVQVRELPELVRSDAYLRDAATTCKAMGLM